MQSRWILLSQQTSTRRINTRISSSTTSSTQQQYAHNKYTSTRIRRRFTTNEKLNNNQSKRSTTIHRHQSIPVCLNIEKSRAIAPTRRFYGVSSGNETCFYSRNYLHRQPKNLLLLRQQQQQQTANQQQKQRQQLSQNRCYYRQNENNNNRNYNYYYNLSSTKRTLSTITTNTNTNNNNDTAATDGGGGEINNSTSTSTSIISNNNNDYSDEYNLGGGNNSNSKYQNRYFSSSPSPQFDYDDGDNDDMENNNGNDDYFNNSDDYDNGNENDEQEEEYLLDLLNDDGNNDDNDEQEDIVSTSINNDNNDLLETQKQKQQQQRQQQRQDQVKAMEILFEANNNNINNDKDGSTTSSSLNNNQQQPPKQRTLHDQQIWFECLSQREHIEKYEQMRKEGQKRNDYKSSLPGIQRHVLSWYIPLRENIEKEQIYFLKHSGNHGNSNAVIMKQIINNNKNKNKRKNKNDDTTTTTTTATESSSTDNISTTELSHNNRIVGPYLCSLQSSKIAVLTCHVLLSKLLSTNSNCLPLSNLALAVGDAIEGEVNIQKVLRKQYKLRQKQKKQQKNNEEGIEENSAEEEQNNNVNSESDIFSDDLFSSSSEENNNTAADDNNDNDEDLPPSWVYSQAQLEKFIMEITGRKNLTYKSMNWAQRKAMELLQEDDYEVEGSLGPQDSNENYDTDNNNDSTSTISPPSLKWKKQHKVALGVACIQMLLNVATIDDGSNNNNGDKKAFTYKKVFIGPGGIQGKRGRKNNIIAGQFENLHLGKSFGGKANGGEFANRKQGYIFINEYLINKLKSSKDDNYMSILPITDFYKPMVVPPKPWTTIHSGAYKWLQSSFMRIEEGMNHQNRGTMNGNNEHSTKNLQMNALDHSCRVGGLKKLFDGLNILGETSWVINPKMLQVAQHCWDNDISIGDIPTQTDYDVPDALPIPENYYQDKAEVFAYHRNKNTNNKQNKDDSNDDEIIQEEEGDSLEEQQRKQERYDEFVAYAESYKKNIRVQQKNYDLNSLRCSAKLKLKQAEQFLSYNDEEGIYFPYNIDFRGRAYPIPPHLSTVGSDLCRGLLTFKDAKPLGKRGLYWLKVHLANLAGADKMSFDGRAAFTDSNMDKIRAAVDDPFHPDNDWWMTSLDDPFQGLATCHEICNAIDSGNPETFMSSLPVHMDGSCNGLQHYAALGRDTVGGKAVNLLDGDEPSDVYIGVMNQVINRVSSDYHKYNNVDDGNDMKKYLDELESKDKKELTKDELQHLKEYKSSRLVHGLIDRGVVKRTVMTSVYGVTFIGAKDQIKEKIEEKLEERGHDIDELEKEINEACNYLANITMDEMGKLFVGAKETMDWLRECASIVSQQGEPVSWITPLGLPVVQPYRQKRSYYVNTLLQSIKLTDSSDDLPIHKQRQRSAFPPNFVHSLDASHMLLTAVEMKKRNLTFCAVHDSFWTHACDVDEMNVALRDTFVELYDQPILENLKESFELCYPTAMFPDLPTKGNLNIHDVKKSKYFFQ